MKNLYLLLTLGLLLFVVPQFAYSQAGTLTVSVDKHSYAKGDIVRVSGTVPAIIEGVPVAVQVFNPRNTMYTILQSTPRDDGTYSASFDITGKLGISGIYIVKATYSNQSVQTTFQFMSSSLTIQIDKPSYTKGETIRITGTVPAVIEGVPVAIQVFNPRNTMYTILQTTPRTDGTYFSEFDIVGKLGINGIYIVKATYSNQSVQTTFQFIEPLSPAGTIRVEFEGKIWNVKATLSNGIINSAEVNPDFISVVISVSVTSAQSGKLEITLPRNLIDSKIGNVDDEFIVLANGKEVSFSDRDKTSSSRSLAISVPLGTTEIEIIGTQVAAFVGSIQITITASTQAANFGIGDIVRISGSVHPITIEQPVVIQVFNPSNTSFMFDEVRIDATGSFTYNFKIEGKLAKIGNYRIDIGYFDSKKSLTINVREGVSVTTGKIAVSGTDLVDATGSSISQVFVDQQVLVQSQVSNNQEITQDYVYIVQIKNSDDIVVSLSWVQGTISAKQTLNVAQSWLPDSSGIYKMQIFVWQSITNPIPLASTNTELELNVSS